MRLTSKSAPGLNTRKYTTYKHLHARLATRLITHATVVAESRFRSCCYFLGSRYLLDRLRETEAVTISMHVHIGACLMIRCMSRRSD